MASDDLRETSADNADRLDRAIGDLRSDLNRGQFKDFWRGVRDVNQLFRSLKPLVREERERLWSAYQSLCEDAKNQRERSERNRGHISTQKRNLVERRLDEAYWQAKSATSSKDLRVASDTLAEALSWMKPGWRQVGVMDDLFHISDGRMTAEDHDACWQ
jgi:hypothetical protein